MNVERSIRNAGTPVGRVVTFTFLSGRSPASSFTEPVAQYLHTETGSTVLLIRLMDAANPVKSGEKPSVNMTFDGGYRQLPELLPTDAGFHLFNLRINHESYRSGWIESLLEEFRGRFDYILIEAVSEELTASWLFEFLLHSDTGYMCIRASNDDVYHLDLLVRELKPQLSDSNVKIKPVLCLCEGELVDGYDALIQ